MEELRLRLIEIKNGNAKEKLSVYSAHDYTLLPLMIGLDISPGQICCSYNIFAADVCDLQLVRITCYELILDGTR